MSGGEVSATFQHRLQYGVFRILRGALEALPESLALGLGSLLGWLVGSVFRIRRDVVAENLRRAFPDQSDAWRDRVAAASYRHLVREAVVTFRMGSASAASIKARTDMPPEFEDFLEDLKAGNGVILAGGHVGNWEMGGAALAARGVPLDAVAQVQRNPLFDRELRETRGRLGMKLMPKQDAPRGVLRSLRRGRVSGLIADQNVARAGVFVDFFGVPASTAKGPAIFSLRTGAPLWAAAALAIPGKPHRYRFVLRRVEAPATGDPDADVAALTRAHLAALEEWVREAPEQYFWQHKRWKTRPPIPEPAS